MSRRISAFVLFALTGAALAGFVLSLSVGSVHIALADLFTSDVVLQLRLPRAVGAFACGGLLALAGALMQVLLRNPLGDPYVLGISGGASVGALLALLFGLSSLFVNGAAFVGALAALFIVFGLARGSAAASQSWTQSRLLLTGIVVSSGCGAIVSLLLALAPERSLRGMVFWLIGDLAQVTQPWPTFGLLVVGVLCVLPLARDLNALARGDWVAASLGVPVERLRLYAYFLAAVFTGGAVATGGSIGFVGLIVPHLLRLVLGNDQRILLPACVLGGGTLLLFADTLARTLIAPQQLPIGALTALIGVPLFLWRLSREGHR